MLSASARLPYRPSRVLVGGTSGSGKSTLAGRITLMIGAAHTEIDSLQHGPAFRAGIGSRRTARGCTAWLRWRRPATWWLASPD
jgi:adenylylsulfate kinase-like enzyme